MIYTSFQCPHLCMTSRAHTIVDRVSLTYSCRNSWTKVGVPQGEYHIRSHSCHAIGSQLLVVGGYPPGFKIEPNVTCSNELIRVFDMNTISVRTPIPAEVIFN